VISNTVVTVLTLILLAAVGAGSALIGSRLAADATEQGTTVVTVDDPSGSDQPPAWAGRSDAGFTGFGGLPALPGVLFRSGVISMHKEGVITVASDATRTTVNYREPVRLFSIRPAAEPLAVGDTVVVRLVDSRAAGVLRLLVDVEAAATAEDDEADDEESGSDGSDSGSGGN
jgi:hypothetical protein